MTSKSKSDRGLGPSVPVRIALVVAALAVAAPGSGQTATVAVPEENFRAEPGGSVVARLFRGTPLRLGETRERWREATLDAWIWHRSVQPQGSRVVVNAGGENLRDGPGGDRIGRAEGGMRLESVDRQGDWLRVRRTGWIWGASLDAPAPSAAAVAGTPDAPPAQPADERGMDPARELLEVAGGTVLMDAPGGDPLARLSSPVSVEAVAREGGWTRVRIEGWVPTAALGGLSAETVLADLSRDSLQADPGRYRGRVVEWTVQFIGVQEAERFRTDFREGEPFVLARGPGEDDGFVYLAVPPERLAAVRALTPLQPVRVLARVRSARSTLTGAPVLELLDIVR